MWAGLASPETSLLVLQETVLLLSPPMVFSLGTGTFGISLCVQISSLQGHQSDWIKVHATSLILTNTFSPNIVTFQGYDTI